ncbi:MAG: ACP S-malonyltransferase, partial [Catenulispora sp.]|nr:ACP S-malonyltransferase [Catenulispora sp.]
SQVVVSGTEDGVAAACDRVETDLGARWVRLYVGGAFHSPLMAPAGRRLGAALRRAGFAAGHAPVVANVDARPHGDGDDWPRLMETQLTAPVRWEECVRTLTGKMGCGRFLELGPGRTLAGLVTRVDARVPVVSAGTPEALAAVAADTADVTP